MFWTLHLVLTQFFFLMRTLKPRDVKSLVHSLTATKWQTEDFYLDGLNLKATAPYCGLLKHKIE